MGKFDFLNNIGESSNSYEVVNIDNKIKDILLYLEILVNRNLMKEDFKNELIEHFVSRKITEKKLNENIQKSILVHEQAEIKLISIDENMFKHKSDEQEYIGTIDRMPFDKTKVLSSRGKASFKFVEHLFRHLKNRVLTLKEVNSFSDLLDFDFLSVFNIEQIKIPTEK